MSWGPMLMMLQPIEEAEFRARVWFSWIVNTFSLPLLIALSSTVWGTEVLISLLCVCERVSAHVCVCVCVCVCHCTVYISCLSTQTITAQQKYMYHTLQFLIKMCITLSNSFIRCQPLLPPSTHTHTHTHTHSP